MRSSTHPSTKVRVTTSSRSDVRSAVVRLFTGVDYLARRLHAIAPRARLAQWHVERILRGSGG